MCYGSSHFSAFLHHFVLVKLCNNSIGVNPFRVFTVAVVSNIISFADLSLRIGILFTVLFCIMKPQISFTWLNNLFDLFTVLFCITKPQMSLYLAK